MATQRFFGPEIVSDNHVWWSQGGTFLVVVPGGGGDELTGSHLPSTKKSEKKSFLADGQWMGAPLAELLPPTPVGVGEEDGQGNPRKLGIIG